MRNISAIIQARCGSSRLENKVFADICGKPLLFHVVERIKQSKYLKDIVIATTSNLKDHGIEKWANENKIKCFRGDEHNVLNRFFLAAEKFQIENIVRITSDDPFKDVNLLDEMIRVYFDSEIDLLTNNNPPSFPEGMDLEIFSFEALRKAEQNANTDFQKEHVTQYFYQNPELFRILNFSQTSNLSNLRWTIDTEKDLEMVRAVYAKLYKENKVFNIQEIYDLLDKYPEMRTINQEVKRSYMYDRK